MTEPRILQPSESDTQFRVHSNAIVHFGQAIADSRELLRSHDAEARKNPGRPSERIEVFKRASVILAVTAWETFIEDSLRNAASLRFAMMERPSDIQHAFNLVAQDWLKGEQKPSKVAALASLCDGGWKNLIRERFEHEVAQLHSPSSAKIAEISLRYLGEDITGTWKWQGSPNSKVKTRLDELIRLRGELVHRGRGFKFANYSKADVRRDQAESAISLVERLADITDRHFNPKHY